MSLNPTTGNLCSTTNNHSTALKGLLKNLTILAMLFLTLAPLQSCGNTSAPITTGPPPSLSISPNSAPTGTVGFAYSLALNASGGTAPYAWSVNTGALPSGVNLNASTGLISGMPAATGTSNFTVQVSDASSPMRTGQMQFMLVINGQLEFTSTALPYGITSVLYNGAPTISGGTAPFTWSITSGGLPPGLSLNTTTGAVTGTPTTMGSYSFALEVTDSSSPHQTAKFFSGIIVYSQLAITTSSLPDGTPGTPYNATLTATGGTGTYTWSISAGSLPEGISLDANSGTLSGAPTTAGQANFTVEVADSANPPQTASVPLSINGVGPENKLLSGSYVLLLQGFDSNGALAMAGSIDADGTGAITGGTLDINRSSGVETNIAVERGNFAINADQRGTLTIQSSLGTQTFRFAINDQGTLARFIESGSLGANAMRDSGLMKKRSTAGISQPTWNGNYAFSFVGSTSSGQRTAVLGAFSTNPAGDIIDGLADGNTAGSLFQQSPIYGRADSLAPNGRGTIRLNAAAIDQLSGIFYQVSAGESFFISMSGDLLSGEILRQAGAPFSRPAAGRTSVLWLVGTMPRGGGAIAAGLVASDSFSGVYDSSEGGNFTSTVVSGGSYAITSPEFGRAAIRFAGHDLVSYAIDSTRTFIMEASGAEVKTGMLEGQAIDDPSNSFPSGNFVEGSSYDGNPDERFQAGIAKLTLAGMLPETSVSKAGSPAVAFGPAEGRTVAFDGRFTAPTGSIVYEISSSRLIEISSQDTVDAALLLLEQ